MVGLIDERCLLVGRHGGFFRRAVARQHAAMGCFAAAMVLLNASACYAVTIVPRGNAAEASLAQQLRVAGQPPEAVARATDAGGVVTGAKLVASMPAFRTDISTAAPASGGGVMVPVGRYRMIMKFEPGVKLRVREGGPGQVSPGADKEQVVLLDVSRKADGSLSCVQRSLSGKVDAQQPTCSATADSFKIVYRDPKAQFDARMEADLKRQADGSYSGPLLMRVVILPTGKTVGQVTLIRS